MVKKLTRFERRREKSRWPHDMAKYFTDARQLPTDRINLYLFAGNRNTWHKKLRVKVKPR